MRNLIKEIVDREGQEVELAGWVGARRDHGKIIFIDLRDRSGITQVVFITKPKELYDLANKLRPEWVVRIKGQVNRRPANMENPNIPTGRYEFLAKELEILTEAKRPQIAVGTEGHEIGEESRMQYRYLDLRRPRLQRNLRSRSKALAAIDAFLKEKDFIEVETPILGKSTPEGARDYLVPSRLYPGKFYALPQAPQQYKQLLMVAGLERYFQVARCFRDEDTRGDRQPEFTQIDLEMSFVKRDDVMEFLEGAMVDLVKSTWPHKKITAVPFPHISYKEAMERYKSDKPDLRKDKNDPDELAFAWIVDFPFYEYSEKDKKWDFGHNPFSMPHNESLPDGGKELGGITAMQ